MRLFAAPHGREVLLSPPSVKESDSTRQIRAMNERILMSALALRRDPYQDYRIGPKDLIDISVFEDEKLNKTVRVNPQGNITLPLIGTLKVKGLTAAELEKEIRELLSERYYHTGPARDLPDFRERRSEGDPHRKPQCDPERSGGGRFLERQ